MCARAVAQVEIASLISTLIMPRIANCFQSPRAVILFSEMEICLHRAAKITAIGERIYLTDISLIAFKPTADRLAADFRILYT